MSDTTHAIAQLRWLVAEDFKGRRGEHWRWDGCVAHVSEHWWEAPWRCKDIEILRSYIAAIRVLEGNRAPGR